MHPTARRIPACCRSHRPDLLANPAAPRRDLEIEKAFRALMQLAPLATVLAAICLAAAPAFGAPLTAPRALRAPLSSWDARGLLAPGGVPGDPDGDGIPTDDGDGVADPCAGGAVLDCDDNCPFTADVDQQDSDGDAVGEVCDNCPSAPNPDQADGDFNGVGDVCEPVKMNFATPQSAIPEGFLGDDGSPFDPDRGYGWTGPVGTRERGSNEPLEKDTFAFSAPPRSWIGELPNGDYSMHVVCGDPSYPQGPQAVSVNGVALVEGVETAADEFTDGFGTFSVRNGRLELSIGANAGHTTLNYFELLAEPVAPVLRSINFQPVESTLPSGFEMDSGYPYNEGLGYGWRFPATESITVPTLETGRPIPQVLDTHAYSTDLVTWEMALSEGFYDVWLSVGDGASASGPHRVVLEGTPVVLNETTRAGTFIERRTGAYVEDGFLTIDIGEGGGVTAINYVVIGEAASDTDGDEADNFDDNCPFATNEDQEDTDDDGLGDSCDPDIDDDGYENPGDNCPDQYNDDQADEDGDGVGDACDECPSDVLNDLDADGWCGFLDNCPHASNSKQEDKDGDGLGDACDSFGVDFCPADSPPADGFRADDGSTFSPLRGYGWDVRVATRKRFTAVPPELDTFAFTSAERAWTAELPSGDYQVRVVIGDARNPQGPQRVTAHGQTVIDDLSTAAGQFVENTIVVPVRTGRLEIEVGGGGGNTTIDLVEIVDAGSAPPGLRSFSFQPSSAATPYGFEADTGDLFDEDLGRGWDAPVPTRRRNRSVPRVLDMFAFSSSTRTWEVEVPSGFYDVFISVGDATYGQGPQRVLVEGELVVNDETTAAREFLERSTFVLVEDGFLTVDIGGAGGNTCLNYLVLAPAIVRNEGEKASGHVR